MPRGSNPGERRGGRRRGTPNKNTALKNAAICAAASGPNSSPLDFILRMMRDQNLPADLRVDMAKSAAPFVHERRKVQRVYRPKSLSAGSPLVATASEQGAGLSPHRSSEPSYSGDRKMEKELKDTAAAGGADLSPLDYLLSVVNDAHAKPRLRIKAARTAAPYLHAHPQPTKGIVIDDPFGFDFDPALARELRDVQVDYRLKSFVTEYPHFENTPRERELKTRIKELRGMLPKRRPSGYTRIHATNDSKRIDEFFDIRRKRQKLTKEDVLRRHI